MDSKLDLSSAIEMDKCSEWHIHQRLDPNFYGRTGHTAAAVGSSIYIFGGTNYKVTFCSDTVNQQRDVGVQREGFSEYPHTTRRSDMSSVKL